MAHSTEFDGFYGRTRRTLLVLALVRTGDLARATALTLEAYEAAWQRWGTLRRSGTQEAWVRRRVLERAQRAPATARGARVQRLPKPDEEQAALLERLRTITSEDRTAWAAVDVAGLGPTAAAQELDLTGATLKQRLRSARAALSRPLGQTPVEDRAAEPAPPPTGGRHWVQPQLRVGSAPAASTAGGTHDPHGADEAWEAHDVVLALGELVARVPLPSPPQLRAARSRAHRWRRLLPPVAAVVLVLVVAALVLRQARSTDERTVSGLVGPPSRTATAAASDGPSDGATTGAAGIEDTDFLSGSDLGAVGPGGWSTGRTTAAPAGVAPADICQRAVSPDPAGVATATRAFRSGDASALEQLTLSRSEALARSAYERLATAWAECSGRTLLLDSAYAVGGAGDEALVLLLGDWSDPTTAYTVALARTGTALVSLTSVEPGTGAATDASPAATALARAVRQVCDLGGGACVGDDVTTTRVPPPTSASSKGLLSTVDLPPPGGITEPWSATRPGPPQAFSSATACDRLALDKQGARDVSSRTFVIPGVPDLPETFGLAETVGRARGTKAAQGVLAEVSSRLQSCGKRLRTARVLQLGRTGGPQQETQSVSWAVSLKVGNGRRSFTRMTMLRRGAAVAQLSFTPGPRNDISRDQMDALEVRALARLTALTR